MASSTNTNSVLIPDPVPEQNVPKLVVPEQPADGIKPQVHGLTELVIKEYRSDRELFNSINFS